MSYEIIKKIRIKDKKVLITGASNNVYPRTFEECESYFLSKILQEQGQQALDIEILNAYEEGNFQRGSNKWTRAWHILKHMPEYKDFNWRLEGLERGKISENRKNGAAFNAILLKALQAKLPEEKFIVSKQYNGKVIYLWKITKRFVKWTAEKAKAQIFNYREDADSLKGACHDSEDWGTEKI